MKTEFKKGLKQGFSLPGFAMGSAMIGFGALAYESNLDYFVTIASMLFYGACLVWFCLLL